MNPTMTLNLNADLGESYGAWRMGADAALLDIVNSANIACGFHAGDALVMRRTVRAARQRGVSIGAHPGFPDLQGFGRRRMEIPPDELEALLIYQIGALQAIAAAEDAQVSHVKPHGALYTMAAADAELARVIARAVRACGGNLILLAPAASRLVSAGREAGLPVVEEIFADRSYQDNGELTPRSAPNALIHGADDALKHVLAMLEAQALISVNGQRIPVKPGSICVHGDNPGAVATARALREGLARQGIALRTLDQISNPGPGANSLAFSH